MRKSFSTFVKEDSEYSTQWLLNRGEIQGCHPDFSTTPYRLTPKKTGLNSKSQVDTKLDESIYYLPYLGICKSQKVLVNILYTVAL